MERSCARELENGGVHFVLKPEVDGLNEGFKIQFVVMFFVEYQGYAVQTLAFPLFSTPFSSPF